MEINKELFFEALQQVATQNLLTIEEIKGIIEESVFKIFHNKFDPDAELELIIDESAKKFELINKSKIVVADEDFNEEYRAIEIPLSEAKKLQKDVEENDTVSEEVDFKFYGKKIAGQIRQLITQAVKEKRKESIFAKHQSLKGEMITATVTSSTSSYVILALEDGTTAFMPAKLRNTNIPLSIGQKTKVFVEDVLKESKDSQIVVSNGSPTMVKRVLEQEIPEIADGIIEVVNISRIAGLRSKVAVKSNSPEIDPIGTIIGAGGERINAIVNKLAGEKLDVVLHSANLDTFVANSLSPARVIAVLDKKNDEGEVIEGHKIAITPNKHQTLGIGKAGSNARLAVELTNTRIDVISIDRANELGLVFEWNGNVTPEQVEAIEAGERASHVSRRPRTGGGHNAQPAFKAGDISDEISQFNETIEDVPTFVPTETKETSFDLDDSMFSEEELKQMESNFSFDSELKEFGNEEEFEFDEADFEDADFDASEFDIEGANEE